MTGHAPDTQNPPVKLSALPDEHGVMICDHVFHGKHAVCDVYYYLGGDISMSCARPECDGAGPRPSRTVPSRGTGKAT